MTPDRRRLHALRIAADLAPRLNGGSDPDKVVAHAALFELYLAGPSSGSEGATDPCPSAARPDKAAGDKPSGKPG